MPNFFGVDDDRLGLGLGEDFHALSDLDLALQLVVGAVRRPQRVDELHSFTRTTEEQDVSVSVPEFESAQTIIGIFEWFGKLDIA